MSAKLTDVVNCIFKDRKSYRNLSNKDKETYFFIINRYLSKKYPEYADKLNNKYIDKSLALDMWYIYLRDKTDWKVFKWFWSKTPKKNNILSDSDNSLLLRKFEIRQEDLDFLLQYYPSFIKEELKYYKDLKKQEN